MRHWSLGGHFTHRRDVCVCVFFVVLLLVPLHRFEVVVEPDTPCGYEGRKQHPCVDDR